MRRLLPFQTNSPLMLRSWDEWRWCVSETTGVPLTQHSDNYASFLTPVRIYTFVSTKIKIRFISAIWLFFRYPDDTSFYRQQIWFYRGLRLQKYLKWSPVSVVQLTCDCMHNRGGAAGGSLICRIYTAPSLNPLAWILELQTKVREDFTMMVEIP